MDSIVCHCILDRGQGIFCYARLVKECFVTTCGSISVSRVRPDSIMMLLLFGRDAKLRTASLQEPRSKSIQESISRLLKAIWSLHAQALRPTNIGSDSNRYGIRILHALAELVASRQHENNFSAKQPAMQNHAPVQQLAWPKHSSWLQNAESHQARHPSREVTY